ncbi:MAG: AgmX/PglI C-terminal domain-containing protein [Deltaproteobacteria bacterium]|nr:AgmX/PglI C-terminal domain-containing protein [Deltaproteobacteria bacterium]
MSFCHQRWPRRARDFGLSAIALVLGCAPAGEVGPEVVAAPPRRATPVASATADAGAPDRWWLHGGCPDDAVLKGRPPPHGVEIGCVKPSGVWHGRRTVWFADCGRGRPCSADNPPLRYQGIYRRGIEHGHWVWWSQSGRKALEGEYFAGRKVGTWLAWDPGGNVRKSQLEVPPPPTVNVDRAIQQALAAAAAVGSKDLKRELDGAARDLKTSRVGPARAESIRALATAELRSIDVRATPGGGSSASWAANLPNEDIGKISFGGGQDRDASPYIRDATQVVTQKVIGCYRAALAGHRSLAGKLVARYTINEDGDVLEALVVQSDMPETMNQCVRAAISALSFGSQDTGQDIQVITPWTFRAP